jgi:hypothetical protein
VRDTRGSGGGTETDVARRSAQDFCVKLSASKRITEVGMLQTLPNITCLNNALVVVVFFKLGNEEDHKTEVCQIGEQQK